MDEKKYIMCGNHGYAHQTGMSFYHYSTEDVKACYQMRGKVPQSVLDGAADGVRVGRNGTILEQKVVTFTDEEDYTDYDVMYGNV